MKKLTLLLILFICSLAAAAQQTKPEPESSIGIQMIGEMDSIIMFTFTDTLGNSHTIPGTGAWWRTNDFIQVYFGREADRDIGYRIIGCVTFEAITYKTKQDD